MSARRLLLMPQQATLRGTGGFRIGRDAVDLAGHGQRWLSFNQCGRTGRAYGKCRIRQVAPRRRDGGAGARAARDLPGLAKIAQSESAEVVGTTGQPPDRVVNIGALDAGNES